MQEGTEELTENLKTNMEDAKKYLGSTGRQVDVVFNVNYGEFQTTTFDILSRKSCCCSSFYGHFCYCRFRNGWDSVRATGGVHKCCLDDSNHQHRGRFTQHPAGPANPQNFHECPQGQRFAVKRWFVHNPLVRSSFRQSFFFYSTA